MWIKRLEISGFRNIGHAELHPSPGYNLITGTNGSGKSSILEAIHCLSTGRSFRTNKKLPIIQQGLTNTTIYGEVISATTHSRAGIQKRKDGSTQLRVDGTSINSHIQLAKLLPVIGSTPEGDDLVSDGPKVRLSYLDWTLFHVEPTFVNSWQQYRRALLQRNRSIKSHEDIRLITSWNDALYRYGNEVDLMRKSAMARLVPLISTIYKRLGGSSELSFSFRQGWPKELSLSQAFERSLATDIRMGFTHIGPQRADIIMTSNSGSIASTFSRGQKKIVILAFKIAQAIDFKNQLGESAILYIDDLPAELDRDNRCRVLGELINLKSQCIVTATSSDEIVLDSAKPERVFHVEQGVVKDVV